MTKFKCDLCKENIDGLRCSWSWHIDDKQINYKLCLECFRSFDEQIWDIVVQKMKENFHRNLKNAKPTRK